MCLQEAIYCTHLCYVFVEKKDCIQKKCFFTPFCKQRKPVHMYTK